MQDGFLSRLVDRLVANARAFRAAPEAIAVAVLIVGGISYSGFRYDRERFAVLNERLASQDRLLSEYRTKLTEARTHIEKLTTALANADKSIKAAKDMPTPVKIRSRDPLSLYENNNPIAQVQDPKIDLDLKKITFPAVNSGAILDIGKVYEFQNWKLACGGTRLYNMVSDGGSRAFSYSPLTCKIVGNR